MKYYEYKMDFMNRHKYNTVEVHTSQMNEDGKYIKQYVMKDGAILTEVNRPYYEEVVVEVKGIKQIVTVELFQTEAWNSDEPNSKFFYEP